MPPTKHDIAGAIRYYVTMCRKLGVDIRTGVEVDEAYLADAAPDAIILATGSVPATPPIPGIDNPRSSPWPTCSTDGGSRA